MSSISTADVKKLRALTGAGVMDSKKALHEALGDFKKAQAILSKKNILKAEKKSNRETKEGYIASYIHMNNQTAALVEVLCETDFVARNSDFQTLAKNLAMQVVSMQPISVEALLAQEYIRDASILIKDLVKQTSGKLGENVVISRFVRYEIGEDSK